MRGSTIDSEERRASTGHSFRTSATSSFATGASRSRETSHNPSNHSRRSSQAAHHDIQPNTVDRELPPIPHVPSTYPPLPRVPSSSFPPLPALPPSQPSSLHPSPAATPPRQPSPTLQPPITPSSLPLKHGPFTNSPSSNVSLVPSEGEDLDAFHVRNTYAQLDMSGVKGDGYEEGVERTRARIGTSRSSQLNALAALGDGTEKTRDLEAKEIETLKSVDRYGFFAVPSHDRLVLLDSAPLVKSLTLVRAGPPSHTNIAKSLSALPPVPLPLKEPSRISKWTRMLTPLTRDQGANVATWAVKGSKESKLRPRTYKGVPDPWRGAAWELLMTRYSKLGAREMELLGLEYREGLDKPSTYDIQIDLDVPRTISGHIMFRTRYGAGQRSLFHVLHCFSLRCETCGYVQGMGPIAATLLCYFEPERVYASLVRLHDAYSLHSVFSPGFPGLLEAIYVQERITEQMMPDVYAAFKKHMISTTSYATKWYITLFANSVPFQTQLRLWDIFLLEGYDVFIAVAVAIVWVYRDHITASSANFETVLSLLSSFFVPEDEDTLLFWIGKTLGDKRMKSNLLKWREDWKGLVASGKDGSALL
ncbi:rab-GTPase-TBC domain-containing protein [Collybia nuda]|uniref:Rab-GTPase-TBC domain-containing protein n=1 Tax=Collybia nuda TaxID=64659 RepID=A0A9P6CKH7_9AGAR|nr:rab-GTPase-TBC domain-containing protein [Collybia nuda]